MSEPVRIALVGNIASNAYLLAKFLRRLGVAADSFDLGGGHVQQSPWWEDAVFDERQLRRLHWAWTKLPTENAYRRPPWAKILGQDSGEAWYDTQEAYEADLGRLFHTGESAFPEEAAAQQAAVRDALAASRTTPEEHAVLTGPACQLTSWRAVQAIARAYDLTVLFGPTAGHGALLPRERKYVTFEHATMRNVPYLDTPGRLLLAASYRHADANILTNADCWEAAGMLGIRDTCRFIPHPVDEERFCPGEAPALRAQLLGMAGVDERGVLCYAPARHSRNEATGTKRNDRYLYAFQRYVREAEPNGAPRAALVLAAWGESLQASAELVDRLGLGQRVQWSACLPKSKLPELYRAADVVLDQFSETVGSYGTCTVEALSCGRPVITYVRPDAHDWCKDVLPLPPVCEARTTDDIYHQLVYLAKDGEERERLGWRSRKWVERYHGWRRVARMHAELYAEVLGVPLARLLAPDATAAPRPDGEIDGKPVYYTDCGPVGVPVAAEGSK